MSGERERQGERASPEERRSSHSRAKDRRGIFILSRAEERRGKQGERVIKRI